MTVVLLDPTIASENLGDGIIQNAVLNVLKEVLPNQQVVHLPTQDVVGKRSKRIARQANWRVVGGTNLLSSNMLQYRQWEINILNAASVGPALLLGVGWWQYQPTPTRYTQAVLRRALSSNGIHSVRDSYTEAKLREIGFENVLNTSCPTTWGLTPDHCRSIAVERAPDVVFTLTDYKPSPTADAALVAYLRTTYRTVYFWPQGTQDLEYLHSLGCAEGVTILAPSVSAFDTLLSECDVEFVGTRLHAGVRSLQHARRTIILAVDNRSKEIGADIGLLVMDRDNLEALSVKIEGQFAANLNLPWENIGRWKAQFATGSQAQS